MVVYNNIIINDKYKTVYTPPRSHGWLPLTSGRLCVDKFRDAFFSLPLEGDGMAAAGLASGE